MSLTIGVDPGLNGALALLDSYGELIELDDMPRIGKAVSVGLLADIFDTHDTNNGILASEPVICVIEDVHSSPQMGVTSAFSFGRSKGVVEGVAAGCNMRLVYVTPGKWKRDMRLGKDKGEARAAAIDRWPKWSDSFKRAKDDGRAEAALIGLWQVQYGQ